MCKKQGTIEELHGNDAKLWDEGWIGLQIAPHGRLINKMLFFFKVWWQIFLGGDFNQSYGH